MQDLAFSENGIWFAAVARGSPNVVIFDLRKEGKAAEAKVLEIGGQVDSLRWDYSGKPCFLTLFAISQGFWDIRLTLTQRNSSPPPVQEALRSRNIRNLVRNGTM